MNQYNFENLNDKDFELLVRDLLQEELNLTLESYKRGRDKGIDLKYTKPKSDKINLIVQAKHYIKSGYNLLKYKLIKEELIKVRVLNPERYIIATSVSLTENNKLEIKDAFEPFILSTADIYDSELLNNLISKYPKIEKKHYKLWLTSINILQQIVQNAIRGRSEFIEENIIKKINLYVKTKNYNDAIKILNEQKFLTIIGEPGIGKTTLAKFLLYNLLAEGYELVYIDEKIKEAEECFSPDAKQIFYFDDFLGSNYLELIQPKNSDASLINFIERVKYNKNKLIILTSRTTILNQAREKFFKLKNKKLDVSKHEVKIDDYSLLDKAKILYNHIYYSVLPDDYSDRIFENRNYWKIINHRNFNPRIIEFITDSYNVLDTDPNLYFEFIIDKLENPHLIWQDAFENQIDDYSKFLLTTLFSLPFEIEDKILIKAYNFRLDYEIKNNGFKRIVNPFYSKVKELLDGFITYERYIDGSGYYKFYNPSISDYLIYFLSEYPDEKWRILNSAIYFEQLNLPYDINSNKHIRIHEEEITKMLKLFRSKEEQVALLSSGSLVLEFITLYILIFESELIIDDIIRIFPKIEYDDMTSVQFDKLITLIEYSNNSSILKNLVLEKFDMIFDTLLRIARDNQDLIVIRTMFEEVNLDFDQFTMNEDRNTKIQEFLDQYWDENLEYIVDTNEDLSDSIEVAEAQEIMKSIYEEVSHLNSLFNVNESPAFDELENIDIESIVDKNIEERDSEDFLSYDEEDESNNYQDIMSEIDEMFTK